MGTTQTSPIWPLLLNTPQEHVMFNYFGKMNLPVMSQLLRAMDNILASTRGTQLHPALVL